MHNENQDSHLVLKGKWAEIWKPFWEGYFLPRLQLERRVRVELFFLLLSGLMGVQFWILFLFLFYISSKFLIRKKGIEYIRDSEPEVNQMMREKWAAWSERNARIFRG